MILSSPSRQMFGQVLFQNAGGMRFAHKSAKKALSHRAVLCVLLSCLFLLLSVISYFWCFLAFAALLMISSCCWLNAFTGQPRSAATPLSLETRNFHGGGVFVRMCVCACAYVHVSHVCMSKKFLFQPNAPQNDPKLQKAV